MPTAEWFAPGPGREGGILATERACLWRRTQPLGLEGEPAGRHSRMCKGPAVWGAWDRIPTAGAPEQPSPPGSGLGVQVEAPGHGETELPSVWWKVPDFQEAGMRPDLRFQALSAQVG